MGKLPTFIGRPYDPQPGCNLLLAQLPLLMLSPLDPPGTSHQLQRPVTLFLLAALPAVAPASCLTLCYVQTHRRLLRLGEATPPSSWGEPVLLSDDAPSSEVGSEVRTPAWVFIPANTLFLHPFAFNVSLCVFIKCVSCGKPSWVFFEVTLQSAF